MSSRAVPLLLAVAQHHDVTAEAPPDIAAYCFRLLPGNINPDLTHGSNRIGISIRVSSEPLTTSLMLVVLVSM
jgi:hypothetical protein